MNVYLKLTWNVHKHRIHSSNKTHLNDFKGEVIIHCLLSDHHGMKLEINNRMMPGKSPNTQIKQHTSKSHAVYTHTHKIGGI